MDPSKGDSRVSRLLAAFQQGDEQAYRELFEVVYHELRRIAHHMRKNWNGDSTMNTSALVSELFEKLLDHPNPSWDDRTHFFRVAAKAMRHILINYARDKRAQKRGGHVEKVSLEPDAPQSANLFALTDDDALKLVALGDALQKMEAVNERWVRIVECRFFVGLEVKETAEVLGLSEATVKRGWSAARAWLYTAIHA
jgi:RNA polymerase sigma factor (TIGR02999 family)